MATSLGWDIKDAFLMSPQPSEEKAYTKIGEDLQVGQVPPRAKGAGLLALDFHDAVRKQRARKAPQST